MSKIPPRTKKNFAEGKLIEYAGQDVLNNLFRENELDRYREYIGFLARVKETAMEQDLIIHLFDFAKNESIKNVLQIDVEERKAWFVPKGISTFEDAFKSWPANYKWWRLLYRKVKLSYGYSDDDLYLIVPKGGHDNICLWWVIGELREGEVSGEYEYRKESDDYRDEYLSKSITDMKGVNFGWEKLIKYLILLRLQDCAGRKRND